MPYETLNLGIELTIPTSGTSNWGTTLKNTTWTKISQHTHTGGGDGQPLTASSIAANVIGKDQLSKNVAFTQAATETPSGATQTLDWDDGNIQEIDLGSATGDILLTLSNPIAGATYRIWIVQGATPRDITWPAACKWPQGQAPILTQDNDAVDMVELYYNGSVYYGQWQNDWR